MKQAAAFLIVMACALMANFASADEFYSWSASYKEVRVPAVLGGLSSTYRQQNEMAKKNALAEARKGAQSLCRGNFDLTEVKFNEGDFIDDNTRTVSVVVGGLCIID